jgi:MFS family permease
MGYAAVTALSPIISADFFEGRAYGSIFGALFMSVSLGGAAGAWFTGFLFDQFKSYVPVFVILVPCTLWAFVNIWIAAPRKIRRVPGKRALRQ